jgi:Kelch motif
MSSRISLSAITVVALMSFVACGGGSLGSKQNNTTFTIGGTVTGVANGDSVILLDNGTDTLTVTSTGASNTFTFNKQVAGGSSYNVTVQTPPPGETCTVMNGTGTANANVTSVQVTCAVPQGLTISVSASGISGAGGLIVSDGIGPDLTFTTNGQQAFTDTYASGANYALAITQQPTGEACTLGSNSTGTITANVTVTATCVSNVPTFSIGGTLSGLSSGTVVLQDNGGDNLSLSANGTFTFLTPVPSGSNYNVTVLTQPTGQTCSVNNGTGTVSAKVTNVAVTCNGSGFTIGGTLSGLASGATVVLSDNGSFDQLSLTANGTFQFSKLLAGGTTYSVTVSTPPSGQSCTVTNGTGTATANVTNIAVACVSQYTISGTVSGMVTGGSVVLQDNGAFETLTVLQNGPFDFTRTIGAGSTYAVTVLTQPTGQTCTVSNGTGTANANVTNVAVTCAATTFTITVSVSGLSGGTFVVQDDAGKQLTFNSSGQQAFSNSYATNAPYSVTVVTQPTGQTCTLGGNSSGTITANVTVTATCAANFTIGGTVTGLTGTGLVLVDNNTDNLAIAADGPFTFATPLASGSTYNVVVATQPTNQTCTVTNGTGVVNGNVTNISVNCAGGGNTFTIGGTIYDLSANSSSTGVTLEYNNANSQTFTTNGTFVFTNPIASGATYTVTVQTQPGSPAQNCTVSNGTGTATANVTNVQVVCISEWTWVDGQNVVALGGIYPVNSNGNPLYPGTRYGTQNWIDASGNFWMFGGLGYDKNGPNISQTTGGSNESVLSDLWEYNSSGWSFQGGDNLTGQCFDYPTSPGPGSPSSRSNAVSWIDSQGNLWMFGGYVAFNVPAFCPSAGAFNDLWEYTAGQWIWKGGGTVPLQPGIYSGSGQIPGARYWASSAVDPATGKLWMFGGYGFDVNDSFGYLNDLWVFDPTSVTWTFVAGSKTADPKGVYSGTGAIPGGRIGANSWIDSAGNFWLFGGDAFDSAAHAGPMNDLWKFPLSGTKWTFVGGSQTNGSGPVLGAQGIPSAGNLPGTREFATSWQTPSGDVWIFGGERLGGALYTDLWKYSGGQWSWIAGSQTVDELGIYPTSTGQTSPTIQPGSRQEGEGWVDANGNLWLFGGYGLASLPSGKSVHDGFDSLQDIWEFQP